jgi:CheY-like chemotaxis protein
LLGTIECNASGQFASPLSQTHFLAEERDGEEGIAMSPTMAAHSILVADHDKDCAALVRRILVAEGYNTNIVVSSFDAIRSASITRPQLLVINPIMFHPSAIEAARQIHLNTNCKVLFLSPLADVPYFREVLADLQKQGCESSALHVPFTGEELLARVRSEVGPSPYSKPDNPAPVSWQQEYSVKPPSPVAALPRTDGLLAIMRPQLYALNAFRITSLDVAASLRDFAPSATAGVVALSRDTFGLGAPSPDQIHAAMKLLETPEQRFLHAFFWFWPLTSDSQTDDALLALHRGELRLAESVWTAAGVIQRELESVQVLFDARCSEAEQATLLARKRNLERAKAISIHNLAVLHHLYALRLETAPKEDRAGHNPERLSAWKKAFTFWSLLLDQQSFSELLPERAEAHEDTRLMSAAQAIRNSLPLALLTINAELAAAAIKAQNIDAALEQRQIMKASAFSPDCVTQALHGGLRPLTEELARFCESAEASSRVNPGYPTVRRLLAEANRCLRGLRALLDTGDSMRAAEHDRIAQSARICLWACVNKTQDWQVAQPLFQECFNLAESNSLRFSLRQDLETIADGIAAQQDHTPVSPASIVAAQLDPKHYGMTAGSVALLLAVVLISAFIAFDRRASSVRPADAQMQISAPQAIPAVSSVPSPASPVPPAEPISADPPPSAAASLVDLAGQRRLITHNAMQLRGMEAALENLKERLAALQYAIEADKTSLDKKQGEAIASVKNAGTKESTRAHSNSSLAAYNSLINDYIAMLRRYKALAESTNAQIASYNSRVGSQSGQLPGYRTKW